MISKDNAEHYTWGKTCDGWHLVKSQGLSVIHERMPSGTSEIRHHHARARQFFFVLSGELTMRIGDRDEAIRTGQGLEIPPGVTHQAINRSPAAVEFLVISEPPTTGDRFEMA